MNYNEWKSHLARLPLTIDGCPITPGLKVYYLTGEDGLTLASTMVRDVSLKGFNLRAVSVRSVGPAPIEVRRLEKPCYYLKENAMKMILKLSRERERNKRRLSVKEASMRS